MSALHQAWKAAQATGGPDTPIKTLPVWAHDIPLLTEEVQEQGEQRWQSFRYHGGVENFRRRQNERRVRAGWPVIEPEE